MPRFHIAAVLTPGTELELPDAAARHVQVLRLQPGDSITLFNGMGGAQAGEFAAEVVRMGRNTVQVRVQSRAALQREAAQAVHLAIGMPANERMDWLVEKATELGAASIQPLSTQRTVLRFDAQRAQKKLQHWQAIAVAACEQCGRNQLPLIHPVSAFGPWLQAAAGGGLARLLLSLQPHAPMLERQALPELAEGGLFLCGPEGGLSNDEEVQALAAGFTAISLGPRVLRSETAALAALARLA